MTSFTPSGTATLRRGRGVQQLLDEERVAAGLVEQPRRQRSVGGPAPRWAATSAAVSERRKPRSADRLHAGLPPEVGEHVSQRAACVRLQVAVGRDDQQARSGSAAEQVPKQKQRRHIGPVQILQDEQQPLGAGSVQQQPHDRVEELVSRALARVLTANDGWSSARTQLGHQARQFLGGGGRKLDLVRQPGTVCCVVPKRLHERLIRRDALLVGSPIKHDPTIGMRPSGNPRDQPRLADARFADQRDHAGLVARDLLPARVQLGQLGRATDKRPRLESRQQRGQRNRALRPARVVWSRLHAAAGKAVRFPADPRLTRSLASVPGTSNAPRPTSRCWMRPLVATLHSRLPESTRRHTRSMLPERAEARVGAVRPGSTSVERCEFVTHPQGGRMRRLSLVTLLITGCLLLAPGAARAEDPHIRRLDRTCSRA